MYIILQLKFINRSLHYYNSISMRAQRHWLELITSLQLHLLSADFCIKCSFSCFTKKPCEVCGIHTYNVQNNYTHFLSLPRLYLRLAEPSIFFIFRGGRGITSALSLVSDVEAKHLAVSRQPSYSNTSRQCNIHNIVYYKHNKCHH